MRKQVSRHKSPRMIKYHPAISVAGTQLEDSGFKIGDFVDIEFEKHKVTIKKV
jgi:hypothetical protein